MDKSKRTPEVEEMLKERGRRFYAAMREKRKMPTVLIDSEGNSYDFSSRQDAGRWLAEKYGRTVTHCTLMLRKTGRFHEFVLDGWEAE